MELPKVSIVIPTLNADKVLKTCLESISIQDYPKENVEVIIVDGGSTDSTLNIARFFNAKILQNPLKTGEAGKSVGVKASTGEFIALIDSDNILPSEKWLKEMIQPLIDNPDVIGSEPWRFEWHKEDGFIDRYCALMGMNDPICYFYGNYDRYNLIDSNWTRIKHLEEDKGEYIIVSFNGKLLPTIGANGTVFESAFLKQINLHDYLFDIDLLSTYLQKNGSVQFVKVKNGITHNYCGSDIAKFIRKQKRRVTDLMYYQNIGIRTYNWANKLLILKFVICTLTTIPLIVQAIKGYSKKHDIAWFFHPLACWIGLIVNTYVVLKSKLFNTHPHIRDSWSQ